jgi:nucleotide-binding universal stress UspA family protein
MTEIKTILHPTDFSEPSTSAFEFACALARDRRARLIVLHVITSPLATLGGLEALPPGPEELNADEAKRQLETVQCPDSSVPLERRLIVGEAADAILQVAAETRSDLIVMGTHGRSGVSRLLMGSVAENVLRKATCPVLTVKAPLPGSPTPPEPTVKSRTSVTVY